MEKVGTGDGKNSEDRELELALDGLDLSELDGDPLSEDDDEILDLLDVVEEDDVSSAPTSDTEIVLSSSGGLFESDAPDASAEDAEGVLLFQDDDEDFLNLMDDNGALDFDGDGDTAESGPEELVLDFDEGAGEFDLNLELDTDEDSDSSETEEFDLDLGLDASGPADDSAADEFDLDLSFDSADDDDAVMDVQEDSDEFELSLDDDSALDEQPAATDEFDPDLDISGPTDDTAAGEFDLDLELDAAEDSDAVTDIQEDPDAFAFSLDEEDSEPQAVDLGFDEELDELSLDFEPGEPVADVPEEMEIETPSGDEEFVLEEEPAGDTGEAFDLESEMEGLDLDFDLEGDGETAESEAPPETAELDGLEGFDLESAPEADSSEDGFELDLDLELDTEGGGLELEESAEEPFALGDDSEGMQALEEEIESDEFGKELEALSLDFDDEATEAPFPEGSGPSVEEAAFASLGDLEEPLEFTDTDEPDGLSQAFEEALGSGLPDEEAASADLGADLEEVEWDIPLETAEDVAEGEPETDYLLDEHADITADADEGDFLLDEIAEETALGLDPPDEDIEQGLETWDEPGPFIETAGVASEEVASGFDFPESVDEQPREELLLSDEEFLEEEPFPEPEELDEKDLLKSDIQMEAEEPFNLNEPDEMPLDDVGEGTSADMRSMISKGVFESRGLADEERTVEKPMKAKKQSGQQALLFGDTDESPLEEIPHEEILTEDISGETVQKFSERPTISDDGSDVIEVSWSDIPSLQDGRLAQLSMEDFGLPAPVGVPPTEGQIEKDLERITEKILARIVPSMVEKLARKIALEKTESIVTEEIERLKSHYEGV